ncbi:MAG: cupin domain-containing protein [Gammaproteobacteria bacterium]|nr:cupin domain-containing protein [Gammaproteobacteria bacterium]
MTRLHIIPFVNESLISSEPSEYRPASDKIISGNPLQRVWSHYSDSTARFSVGIWECEPGAWRIHYTEDEYCRILAGRSLLTNDEGVVREVIAGDEFIIPRGFTGIWEVLECTRKVYVICEYSN